MSRRVVVTGMGAVSPIGNTVEELWSSLVNGRSGTGLLTRFDATKFSSRIAAEVKGFDPTLYIDKKEIRRLSYFCQYALAASAMAIQNSQLDVESLDKNRVGVLIGSGIGGIEAIEEQKEVLDAKGPRRISPFLIPKLIINMAAGLVSMRYGFGGPNTAITTACATGAHSIGEAMRLVQRGQTDVVVAGGSEAALTPLGFGGFCTMKALSTNNDDPEHASRPFDKNRDGFVMGEGAGIVILEDLEHARKRGAEIFGEIVGYGMSADAYHITMPDPDGRGACEAMRTALEDAGISTDRVDYINAHGTSTPYNDKTETKAIKTLFNSYAKKVAVSSTKSMTGHLLGAGGAVEFIAMTLALQNGIIPPTINYCTPDPECDLDYVPNTARELKIQYAMSNSFGFGGHNAVLIARRFE